MVKSFSLEDTSKSGKVTQKGAVDVALLRASEIPDLKAHQQRLVSIAH